MHADYNSEWCANHAVHQQNLIGLRGTTNLLVSTPAVKRGWPSKSRPPSQGGKYSRKKKEQAVATPKIGKQNVPRVTHDEHPVLHVSTVSEHFAVSSLGRTNLLKYLHIAEPSNRSTDSTLFNGRL